MSTTVAKVFGSREVKTEEHREIIRMLTEETEGTIQITDGPGKDDLLECFARAFDKAYLTVQFKLGWQRREPVEHYHSNTLVSCINSLEHEDGSGKSFMITGRARNPITMEFSDFRGYYHAGSRKGWIEFGN